MAILLSARPEVATTEAAEDSGPPGILPFAL
jgi:hypothetical protein